MGAFKISPVVSKKLGHSWERAAVVSENAPVRRNQSMRLQGSCGVACKLCEFIHNNLVEKYIKILEY